MLSRYHYHQLSFCKRLLPIYRNRNVTKCFSTSVAPVTDVRKNHQFDENKLAEYLNSKGLNGFQNNEIVVKQFSHGQSNPSFMVTAADGKKYTVRKQPPGKLLAGAHAIDREYAVMTALKHTNVAVPETRFYCEDPNILGSPFFVYGMVLYLTVY